MDKGAHYYRTDLQVHTPRDRRWVGGNATSDSERESFANAFIAECRAAGVQAVAITDHHDLAMVRFIRDAAKREQVPDGQKIVVFPGMELTLAVPCQALLIFDAEFPNDMFALVYNALAITPAPDSEPKCANILRLDHLTTLPKLYDELNKHDYLRGKFVIFPNVSETGHGTLLRSNFASHYKAMPCVGGYLDGALTQLGNGNKSILGGKDVTRPVLASPLAPPRRQVFHQQERFGGLAFPSVAQRPAR